MASVHMCRERDRMLNSILPPPDPIRFTRKPRKGRVVLEQNPLWQAEESGSQTLMPNQTINLNSPKPHRDEPLLPRNRKNGVVTSWPSCGRVNKHVDRLVDNGIRRPLRKHDVEVDGAEDLLQRVKCQPAELTFDEIWAILHDRLELQVPVAALPPGDKVQHVRALGGLAVLPAGGAGQGDGERREEGQVGGLVPHPQQSREEVDLGRHGRDGEQAGGAHDEEGEYCLVGKVGVDVGRLL